MSEPGAEARVDVATTEAFLAEIWVELLEVDVVESTDHLLDLGGNSLIATMIGNRIEVAWRFRPRMETILSASLGELSAVCARGRRDV